MPSNVIDILKLGLIGLGFLLAYLSYLLLSRELKRDKIRPAAMRTLRFFMIFCVLLSVLTIFWEFVKVNPYPQLSIGNTKFQVDDAKYRSIDNVNASDNYINSTYGFAFKKMDENWSNVREFTGLQGIVEVNGLDSTTASTFADAISETQLAALINSQRVFQVEQLNSKRKLEITDSTKSQSMEDIILNEDDTTSVSAADFQHSDLKFFAAHDDEPLSFELKNQYSVSVFDKSKLPKQLQKMSLADFFKMNITAIPSISQIVTTKNSIYLKGVSAKIENVLINRKPQLVQVDKLMLFTSSKKYYYVVEAIYSPQTLARVETFEDLESLLQSFVILKD